MFFKHKLSRLKLRGGETIAAVAVSSYKNEAVAVIIYLYWTPAGNIDPGLVSPF